MNTLRNTVNLIGRLGKNPELKEFTNSKLATFSIATSDNYKNKEGEWVDNTTWHNVKAWGKTAELCSNLMKKGVEVAIEGKLVNNTYETKEGEKRYTTEIEMREFIILTKEKEN
jgi:single-strand DNA-binding protein